ncbi:peptidyl-prolyl cis-trans isomerase FKBP14 [Hydra vulgaris]|uniref:peptidylprolyl isomerase n=1 Tax=Hydra vulgaris TaxID=6087 RepID=T2M4E9_HYDVU|nr:peptidyl-prolyl cis-trans isomerase FKBP14 [Hydra vulgaris]
MNTFYCILHFILLFSFVLCDTEESPVEQDDEGDSVEQAGVLDPEVRESLRYSKHEDQFDTAHIKTGKDEILPFIEYLYVPKNCKRKSANNDLMVVHYTGWLAKSGRKFDSTIDVRRRYVPFEFVIGTGYVIRGWEKGLLEMCPGEKRRITVPPEIGYGSKGLRGMIPPNSTLVFVVDLLDLRRAAPNYAPMDLFTSLDRNNDKVLSRDEIAHYVRYQAKTYRNKNAPPPSEEEHEKIVDDIMSKEDLNGDGHIQHSEFSGSKLHHNEL